MTTPRECPRCGHTGLIRAERVIKAGKGITEWVCAICGHMWSAADDAPGGPERDRTR